jgi:hypothetical protein
MSLQSDAQKVYEYLTTQVLSSSPRKPVPYGQVEKDTDVPIGEHGAYIGQVLGVVSRSCMRRGLPPLTSIVVRGDDQMPGSGYFVELATADQDGNPAGWRIDPGIDRWIRKPTPAGFDKDTDRWAYQQMIAEHQQSVWHHAGWPTSL